MKIKNSKDISLLKILPLFYIAAALCAVLRCVQVAFFIDNETGFFKSDSFICSALYVVLGVAAVAICLAAYLSKDCKDISLPGIKSNSLFFASLIFSITLVADWVSSFFTCIKDFSQISDTSFGLFKSMMASGSLPGFLQSVFALLSAIYILLLAVSFRNGTNKASERKILALAPVCWASFRMIRLFVTEISFVQISDLLLELLVSGFFVLFFVALAQNVSGIYVKGFQWRIFAFGLCGALISGSLAASRFIFTLINASEYINSAYTFDVCDFGFFVFAAVLAASMIKEKNSAEEYTE